VVVKEEAELIDLVKKMKPGERIEVTKSEQVRYFLDNSKFSFVF
jgi:hypothetical protein